jgi:hypothetical protein
MPLTCESKPILVYAAEQANRMDHYRMDTDHLVLGRLREGNRTAALGGWRPSKPTTFDGQIAAAVYLLLIVELLKFFTERSC